MWDADLLIKVIKLKLAFEGRSTHCSEDMKYQNSRRQPGRNKRQTSIGTGDVLSHSLN